MKIALVIFGLLLILSFNERSVAQEVRGNPEPAIRFAAFKGTSIRKEQAVLDKFAVLLSNAPDQIGYILVYAGRSSCFNEPKVRGERMKKYLVEQHHIESDRVIWLNGGNLQTPYVLLEMQLRGRIYSFAATHSRSDEKCYPLKPRF